MQARVWNDNTYPFTDPDFKGDKIHIPSKSYIEMEYNEANEFRGKFSPIYRDADGQPTPQSYKMIRIEKIEDSSPKEKVAEMHACHGCRDKFLTKEELENHIDEHHLDQLTDAELAQKRRGKAKKDAA